MDTTSLKKRIESLPQSDGKSDPNILKARQEYARSHMVWYVKEDEILRDLCQENFSIVSLAQLLKRSNRAIEERIKLLGITMPVGAQKQEINTKKDDKPENDEKSVKIKQTQVHQIIRYWRNSLADADKMGVPPEKMKKGEQFTLQLFKDGRLPQNKIQHFFDEAERALKEKNKKRKVPGQKNEVEEPVVNKLQVIIAPYTAVKNYEHGKTITWNKSPDNVFPLWLVANLTREGGLIPTEEVIFPWIDRKCLTPNEDSIEGIGYPIIGDVSQVDEYYAKCKNVFDDGKIDWKKLFLFAQNLFQQLMEKNDTIFAEQNYTLIEEGYILPTNEVMEPSRNIIATYDQYLFATSKKIPRLLKKFCSLKDHEYCPDKPIEALFAESQNHLGQMQNKYPLSASQRLSLSYLSDAKHNNIFTVHGPPGTGKTSLLLSVIASRWVEAALQKNPPPILVAASTNNLAVTNILDNFKQVGQDSSESTSIRWLPDFTSYGLYLVSTTNSKIAKEKNYPYRVKEKGSSSIEEFYTSEYREHAKVHFLKQFNQYYKKSESELTRCQTFIHEEMLEKQALLHEAICFIQIFYNAKEGIIKNYGNVEEVYALITKNNDKKSALDNHIKTLKSLRINWLLYKTTTLKWPRLFVWIPFVKSLLIDRIKLFVEKNEDLFSKTITQIEDIDKILDKVIDEQVSFYKEIVESLAALELIKVSYEAFYQTKLVLEQELGFRLSADNLFDFADTTNVLCKLDKTLRYDLFVLATHYWEIAWLLESESIASLSYDSEGRKKYWQIHAMLTPCFVTTLHSGSSFFQYKAPSQKFETLANFVDLLIIDEAGQVMPAIAGALISTAKKALLVGDAKQIEPIFSLPEGIDLANAKKFGLCTTEQEYEQLKQMGTLCSGDAKTQHAYGNLIVVGQRKAKFHLQKQAVPGMLLKEHRRCAKEIISYCNELCYDHQLIPMTNEKPCIYPRMGYAHIRGYEEKRGSSRFNQLEAETIVEWIVKNEKEILLTCEAENLSDCIGIVTPFAAQSSVIRAKLKERDIHLDKVGTIHTLQGAEKAIVIFSPVYTSGEKQGMFFFDKSPNMLNVAVSRAKMSFLVFGDIDIFDPRGNQPSALLAKYLFAREENEIVDIIQPRFKSVGDKEIRQINTLKDHQIVLKKSFSRAENELNIVSPFLTISAIEVDNIPALIKKYSPSIIINIYTDLGLNKRRSDEFRRAKIMLEEAGATVILVNNVHSKIIAIDDRVIIEGSFNWLSAARVIDQFKREESSVIYTGKYVAEFIRAAIDPVRNKAIVKDHIQNGLMRMI